MRPSRHEEFPVPLRWITTASLFLFIGFLIVAWPGLTGHGGDRGYWNIWASYIKQHGLIKAYGSGTDYPPLYQYFLWMYAALCSDVEEVSRNLARLRIITVIFDIAGMWLAARWIGRQYWWQALALFSLVNVAYSYNSIVWGQVDGILATLVFASLYSVWRRRPLLSAALFGLALSFKIQGIIFLPLWGLLMLNDAALTRRWISLLWAAPVLVGTILLVCLPFLLTADSRTALYSAIFGSVDRYPYTSMMAENIWYWLVEDPRRTEDTGILIAGLTYKTAGMLFFFAASALALWPLLRRVAMNVFAPQKALPISRQMVWLTATLITLVFFFFNTQMHERYSHPVLILLTAYAFYTRDFFPYILACIAYFLNLEIANLWMLYHYHWFVFNPWILPGYWALLMVYLFARLYGWRKWLQPVEDIWPAHPRSQENPSASMPAAKSKG